MKNVILDIPSATQMAKNPFTEQHISILGTEGSETLIGFREMIDWINEGIYCVDGNGIIVYANEQFCNRLGYLTSEIVGADIFERIYNEDNIRLARAKLQLRKRGVSDSYNIQLKTKTGEAIWVRMNGKPIMSDSGEFIGSVVISTDINQQLKLEEELIQAKEDLESKVITRTRQLSEANQKLYEQIKERRLAEISSKNSEKRFRDIFVNSPDAIYIESHDGIILDVNEASCKLQESSEEELRGKSIFDVSPVKNHDEIRKRQPGIISGEIKKFESECLTNNGRIIPIEISVAPISFNGAPAMLMHVRDITDRKQNQQLLQELNTELEQKVKERTRELEEVNARMRNEIYTREKIQKELLRQKDFLRLIIDSTPTLIFVKDQEGKFLLANKSTATFYNMTTEEMEGHYDTDHNFDEKEIADFKNQDEEILSGGKEISFPIQSFVNKKNGKVTWLQTIKKPIPSISGNEINVLGVSTDITDIKQTKDSLKTTELLYREIARNLPKAGMFIFDKQLQYILAEGPLIGVISKPKAEIEGRSVTDTINEKERERVEKIYRDILLGKASEREQVFFGRQLKVYHIPIYNDAGEVIYGMVMVFDISDLKETQVELEKRATQLQRSNDELERFAYVASHDLQGPLRTIASYLQLLEMRYKNNLDAEALEFINFSVNGAKRMQTLILDLLNYSRISSAPKPFVKTNANEIVEGVIQTLQSSIKTGNATIKLLTLPVLLAEPNQLFLLFQNLIDNAIKFVKDKKPVITISCTEKTTEWKFEVADNGIGIREDFKEKVFQIFQRLHAETEYPGTGVGLAICKKIVDLHNGRIWFETNADGGTTFCFTVSKNLEKS